MEKHLEQQKKNYKKKQQMNNTSAKEYQEECKKTEMYEEKVRKAQKKLKESNCNVSQLRLLGAMTNIFWIHSFSELVLSDGIIRK